MDAFESVVGDLLWREGYWVQPSFKVELSKEEKAAVGRPTTPRWELDLVGYSGGRNELLAVECKSYLDWSGVTYGAFDGSDERMASRFKLFNDDELWRVVRERLCRQLTQAKLVSQEPQARLALACGKIASERDREAMHELFDRKGWLLLDDRWLRRKLEDLSRVGYENSSVALVAKLLLRS